MLGTAKEERPLEAFEGVDYLRVSPDGSLTTPSSAPQPVQDGLPCASLLAAARLASLLPSGALVSASERVPSSREDEADELWTSRTMMDYGEL